MAEQNIHDVVNQKMSEGEQSLSDANEANPIRHSAREDTTALETGGDIRNDESSQVQHDQRLGGDAANLSMLNGQAHTDSMPFQTNSVETTAQADNTNQESDFDGNISRNQSVGDLSTESDTDNRKAGPSSASEDSKIHDAGNAARRPASFKPVSFAKYSAAKVAGINSAARPFSDKVLSSSANSSTSSLQQGSRPRLVAKSTSGLRDNVSKSFKPGGKSGAGGPDPMQVWNKNRPAPPPSTKHLTDEELKQQYGIHMTTRIEADGESKEAKWADIDDDEDDWAPETIEWADGTKVTLNHTSNMPLPQEVTKHENPPREQLQEPQTVMPKAPQATSSVGPNATVLKLGASAERQQAQKATILQKGPSEKAVPPAAKSPAPVPAKSPWAPLPPVDKVSPITINPQSPILPTNRYSQVVPGGPSPPTGTAPSPAKEMSADDFNRSLRDAQPGQPRELFMPNSGRYEAVSESRRRGSRNDQSFRAPALLQRPNPSDQHAPAEPSPAFQTSRMSADQDRGPWNRRRASSIQSGGSGQLGRTTSVSKGGDAAPMHPELLEQQRGFSEASATDVAAASNGIHIQQNADPQPTSSAAGRPGQAPDLALIAEQKRLMQESARLAVQRRREEELKEDAARKERIRLKLEQLGPPPDQKAKGSEQSAEAAPKPEDSVAQLPSPPKPPVPEASGEPKQYGMMKVYHPDNVKKFTPPAEKPETSSDAKAHDMETAARSDLATSSAPTTNGIRPHAEVPNERPSSEPQNSPLPPDENIQPWKKNYAVTEPVSSWGSRKHHPGPATSNLWGPPNYDKALGNGTFDQRLTGLPAGDVSVGSNTQQQVWFNDRQSAHEKSPPMPSMRPASQKSMHYTASPPSPEQRPIAANSEADSLQPVGKPLPIGPPQAQTSSQRWQQPPNARHANNGTTAWNNFHSVAAREDRADNDRFQRDLAASREEEARTGTRRAPQYTFTETWKQVEVGDQTGERQVASVAKSNINPPFAAGHPHATPGSNLNGDRAMNGLPIRGSRFFPTDARRAVTYNYPEISRSPSPPPAEEPGGLHPAYSGDTMRPVINFPAPKAVVKLPKSHQKPNVAPATPPPPRTFAAAVAAQPPPPQPSLRAVSQPLVRTPDWQHRFNDLFGRKSPPKKQVLAIASSSREPLDVVPVNVTAAVSLPLREIDLKDAGKVTSRDVGEQEDLFEDREAASVPLVQLPRDAPENLWHPARISQLRSKGGRYLKTEVDPVSISSYDVADDYTRGSKGKEMIFYVDLPGSTKPIKKTMIRKGGNNGFATKGPKSHNSKQHKKGPSKSRDSSGSFPNVQQNNRGISTRLPPTANGLLSTPRSGFLHNSNNNNNNNNNGWRGSHYASAGVAH